MKSGIKKIIEAAIAIIIAVIGLIAIPGFRSCVSFIYSQLLDHPIFLGVMISWFVAFSSTGIVFLFARFNRDKKQYEEILNDYGKWLTAISILVIFYISINLASEALTGSGVPIFSEPYKIVIPNVTPQDAFLILLVFIIISLVFIIAPRWGHGVTQKTFIIMSLAMILGLLFLFSFSGYAKPISETFISWDNVPGDDNEKLINFLKDEFDIDWAENAEISKSNDGTTINISKDENSVEIMMGAKKEKATLKISDGRTHDLKVKKEDDKLYIYPERPQKRESIQPFGIPIVVGLLSLAVLWRRKPDKVKKFKDDLRDLRLYFSIIPAFFVASLVLIRHDLIIFPNLAGHIVVGFLFISGFATLVILTRIALKDRSTGLWIWGSCVAISLLAISLCSVVFLLLEDRIHEIDTFRKILMFSIAIILVILQYGFAYEKLLKYRFTEWWRREVKPIAMIIAILAIVIVSAFKSDLLKLIMIGIILIFVVCLPWLFGIKKFGFRKFVHRIFKFERPQVLSEYQGIVLVKAKTDPGCLKTVVDELDDMEKEGVYQTMVVRGEYDVCLIVEGVSSADIAEKILEIRKIHGVASTTTLTDIREFFDREVK